MKDLRSLLRTVEVATSKTTKQNIQEGILGLIRNNTTIKFDVALKLMTMSCNILDHNTVVKLNKMIEDLNPVGESLEDILDNAETAAKHIGAGGIDQEAFEAMKEQIQNIFVGTQPTLLANKEESKAEVEDFGLDQNQIAHNEDITYPCPIVVVEMDEMDQALLDYLKKVMYVTKADKDNLIGYVKSVILNSTVYKYCKLGESVVKFIVNNFCAIHNLEIEKVLEENAEELLKLMNTFLAIYVLANMETNTDKQKELIAKTIDAVMEGLENSQYGEFINYNRKWAVIVGDTIYLHYNLFYGIEEDKEFDEKRVIDKLASENTDPEFEKLFNQSQEKKDSSIPVLTSDEFNERRRGLKLELPLER